MLAITIRHFDDEIVVGVQDERHEAVLHVDTGDHAFLENIVKRNLLHASAAALDALLELLLISLDDEALLGAVVPVDDRRAPIGDELLDRSHAGLRKTLSRAPPVMSQLNVV